MLNKKIKLSLKSKAHHLKPVVLIGANGLTDSVVNEIDSALLAHELIKIKMNGADKLTRTETANMICIKLNAELIQLIGNTMTIYRELTD